jgi:hypothetical protein
MDTRWLRAEHYGVYKTSDNGRTKPWLVKFRDTTNWRRTVYIGRFELYTDAVAAAKAYLAKHPRTNASSHKYQQLRHAGSRQATHKAEANHSCPTSME